MKIMIFGDTASGKSTFADKLGKIHNIKVTHLDMLMDSLGRENKSEIKKNIDELVNKENWIIEGNAFTKDFDSRIKSADTIFVFKSNSVKTFFRHLKRSFKILFKDEKRIGSLNTSLNLSYFIPYIFWKFPKRRNLAIKLAQSNNKKLIEIHSYKNSEKYLSKLK